MGGGGGVMVQRRGGGPLKGPPPSPYSLPEEVGFLKKKIFCYFKEMLVSLCYMIAYIQQK